MKLVKTANNKKTIKISKKEWKDIGKKAGWISKTAKFSDIPSHTIYDHYGWLKEKVLPLWNTFNNQKKQVADFVKTQMSGTSSNEEYNAKKTQYMNLLNAQKETWNAIKSIADEAGESNITEDDLRNRFSRMQGLKTL